MFPSAGEIARPLRKLMPSILSQEERTMRTLGNILIGLLAIVGILCLVPLFTLGLGLATALLVFAIWLLPFLIIATSDKTTGFEKIAWLLAMVCLSWFAWVFYFFLAPIKPRREFDRYHYRY